MKKFMIFVLVLLLLVGGAVIALPKLVSMEKIEAEAKSQFHAATGRDIAFDKPRLFFWPNIGVKLKNVTISNPKWAKDKNMLELAEMEVSLALRSLLDKQIEVKRFTLKAPVISLEKASDGRTSWELSGTAKKVADNQDAGKSASASSSMKGYGLKLGEFMLADGKVTYRDGATGKTEMLEDVDMSVNLPDLNSALDMDGAFKYHGKRINVVVGLEKPMALVDGSSSKGSLDIRADDVTAKISGLIATSGTFLKGDIDANISSLSKLVAFINGTEAEKLPFEKISFKSSAEVTADKMKLSGASLSLDDLNAGGDVTVNYSSAKPDIYARLAIDKIDLDRFVGGEDAGAAAGNKTATAQGQTKWDDTPIDFSGLKAVNADLILQTKGFSLKGADVGPSNLVVKLDGGNLSFKSSEASLFDGKFSSDLSVNAATSTPSMSFKFDMTGVQAKPVLTTFADFKKLSGAADANVAVTSSGKSQRAIIEGLNGQGAVVFKDGSLEGIDLVNIAKMIQSKLTNMNIGEGKTDFVELGGTFTITRGVATNKDLKMRGPLVQASGSGDVDLPAKMVAYRIVPVLTASSAVDNAGGISVPVDVKGPFNNIKIKPDYAAVIQNALKNPEEIKKTLKNVEDQFDPMKDNFKTLKKDLKKDPAKALQGLLGGGMFGQQPAAPAPAEPAPATVP